MTSEVMRNTLFKAAAILGSIAIVVAIGFLVVTQVPSIREHIVTFLSVDEEEEKDDAHPDHEEHDKEILVLSVQAQRTVNPIIERLGKRPYIRPLRVPGIVVPIAGVSQQDITAVSTARVTQIYVREGQTIEPGDPIFDLSIVAPEAITTQLELIDALAELEGVAAEIDRLSSLSAGSIAGKDILAQRYLREQLLHTVSSRRDTLLLLGFAEEGVDAIIENHQHRHIDFDNPTHADLESLLLDHVTLVAPAAPDASLKQAYVVEHITAKLGEQVEGGRQLCQLSDYSQLHIKGEVFERSLDVIRNAAENDWAITATWEESNRGRQAIHDMPILFIAPEVNAESRTTHFHVTLENKALRTYQLEGRTYVDWQFRPGQRMNLQIPIEYFEEAFVVPIEAVANDGVNNYIFRAIDGGPEFKRFPITILYRGPDDVVFESEELFEAMKVAMSGAHQLQMSLVAQQQGPAGVDPHAGHSHD